MNVHIQDTKNYFQVVFCHAYGVYTDTFSSP